MKCCREDFFQPFGGWCLSELDDQLAHQGVIEPGTHEAKEKADRNRRACKHKERASDGGDTRRSPRG